MAGRTPAATAPPLLDPLLTAVYQRCLGAEERAALLAACPGVSWLATCAEQSPLPCGWHAQQARAPRRAPLLYVCGLTGEVSQVPPHLARFAELARILLYVTDQPQEAASAWAWAQRESRQALEEGRSLLVGWAPHFDEASGCQYWHCELSGRSSWESPAASAVYYSKVAAQVLELAGPSKLRSGHGAACCALSCSSSCSTGTGDSDPEEDLPLSAGASSRLPGSPLPGTPSGLPSTPSSSSGPVSPVADAHLFFTARGDASPRPQEDGPRPADTPASALVDTAAALAAVATALSGKAPVASALDPAATPRTAAAELSSAVAAVQRALRRWPGVPEAAAQEKAPLEERALSAVAEVQHDVAAPPVPDEQPVQAVAEAAPETQAAKPEPGAKAAEEVLPNSRPPTPNGSLARPLLSSPAFATFAGGQGDASKGVRRLAVPPLQLPTRT